MRTKAHLSSDQRAGRERVALVKLPELPLQLLLRERPEFRGQPTAVLTGEGPEARITHLNRAARATGLRLGMTHASARDRLPALHTGVVSPDEVHALEEDLAQGLQLFSPRVEPCPHFPSTFFIDPNGMEKLFGGIEAWATATHAFLEGRSLFGATWVGFHRYRLYAAAGMSLKRRVLDSPEEEQLLANGASLRELGLDAQLCDDLALLEVHSLGDLLALPAGEFGGRFGIQAAAQRALFAEEAQLPLQSIGFEEPTEARFEVNPPDANTERLLFGIKAALHPLLLGLRERGEHIRALTIHLELEVPEEPPGGAGKAHDRERDERIEPAAPTGDLMTLVELIRLRLQSTRLSHPVESVRLHAETERAQAEAMVLEGLGDQTRPQRDSRAAARALARLRAAYGPRAVVRARTREAHLPEARFAWVPTLEPPRGANPLSRISAANEDAPMDPQVLVRRVLRKPQPLRSRPSASGARTRGRLPGVGRAPSSVSGPPKSKSKAPSGGRPESLPESPEGGAVERMYGPYRVSGGWWKRTVERDYYYAETDEGALLWVFWDRPRQRWFLHGRVD